MPVSPSDSIDGWIPGRLAPDVKRAVTNEFPDDWADPLWWFLKCGGDVFYLGVRIAAVEMLMDRRTDIA